MTRLDVLAPAPGMVAALSAVPDPVFAQAMVGPGLAVDPLAVDPLAVDPLAGAVAPAGATTVVAPVSGRVVKLHPHVVVISAAGGAAVLTHLGVDTVQLSGVGFEPHVSEDEEVMAGDPLTTWSPAAVSAGGRSAVVAVVALNATPGAIVATRKPGELIDAGDLLFTWTL